MLNCCVMPTAPDYCFRVPDNYLDLSLLLPNCRSYASARAISVEQSSNLLHAAPVKHDPYTPDSMDDSPSPNAIATLGQVADDAEESSSFGGHSSRIRRIDRAVSPALLKSKLELIARNERQDSLDSDSDPRKSSTETGHLHQPRCLLFYHHYYYLLFYSHSSPLYTIYLYLLFYYYYYYYPLGRSWPVSPMLLHARRTTTTVA